MSKLFKKLLVCALALMLGLTAFAGCSCNDDGEVDESELEQTPADKNSWEYLDPSEEITLTWYVDVAGWSPPTMDLDVGKAIKAKTGITLEFVKPVDDSGQKLQTLLADDLDGIDLITLTTANSQLGQLPKQGYVRDIDTMSEKWAPSLKRNLRSDVWEWWKQSNGKTYGIPNHYYSYDDIPANTKLQPNGGMMVRKDIFNAWQTYISGQATGGKITYTDDVSGQPKQVVAEGYITTPEGFRDAAKWALQNYPELTTGLQLNAFDSSGNTSFEWLSQFFAVPFEDTDGNWVYKFESNEYKTMMKWVNSLYNTKVGDERIISESNFAQKSDSIQGVISNAQAFATLVTPQSYQGEFLTAKETNADHEYISLYITNHNGDAPVLQDIRGYGYFFNMVSKSCKRPDIAIKLLDFLTSDEGQRLILFGEETKLWNWANEEKTEIKHTDEYLTKKANNDTANIGLMRFDMLINYQYYDNARAKTNHGQSSGDLYMSNLKRPLSIYTYDYNAAKFTVDGTQDGYDNYTQALTRVNQVLTQKLAAIIKAADATAFNNQYTQTVNTMKQRNLELVKTTQNTAYQAAKTKLKDMGKLSGNFAWPCYQDGFVNNVDRTKPNGDVSYYRGY